MMYDDTMFLGSRPSRPVVAVDVDGTISRYHEWFTLFARQYTGRNLSPNFLSEYKGEFSEALGLEKSEYRDIKLAYRQGGLKRSMPCFPGAKSLIDMIHEAGAEVWFCTTRPWQRLDNIDPDTREHFRRQGLRYNGLIYGEHKYHDLLEIVGKDRVVCVLEDLPEQIEEARALGFRCLLRRGDHNVWWKMFPGYQVWQLGDAQILIGQLIEEWKDRQ